MAPDCVFTFVSRAFGFLNFIFWTPFFDREGPGGRPRRFGTDRLPVETGSTAFFTFLSSTIGSLEGGFRIELKKVFISVTEFQVVLDGYRDDAPHFTLANMITYVALVLGLISGSSSSFSDSSSKSNMASNFIPSNSNSPEGKLYVFV